MQTRTSQLSPFQSYYKLAVRRGRTTSTAATGGPVRVKTRFKKLSHELQQKRGRGYYPRRIFEKNRCLIVGYAFCCSLLTPLTHQLLINNFLFLTNLQNGKCEKRMKHFITVQHTIGSYNKPPRPENSPSPRLQSGGPSHGLATAAYQYQEFIACLTENASL